VVGQRDFSCSPKHSDQPWVPSSLHSMVNRGSFPLRIIKAIGQVNCVSSPGALVLRSSSYVPSWHAVGQLYLQRQTLESLQKTCTCLQDYTPSHTRQSPSHNITSNKTNLFVQCIHQHISEIICHLTKHFIHFYTVREGTVRYHFVFKVFVLRTDFYTTVSSDVLYLVA
jgi:hypothetical protein